MAAFPYLAAHGQGFATRRYSSLYGGVFVSANGDAEMFVTALPSFIPEFRAFIPRNKRPPICGRTLRAVFTDRKGGLL
jgi:hypothetical protein